MFDCFISYRRATGSGYAARIYDYLCLKNFDPFFDRVGIESGRFDEQIRVNLINAENFIAVLSKTSFDRIFEDDDWVRKEISLAISHNLNIIVLKEDGFEFPKKALPEDIKNFTNYEMYEFNDATLGNILKTVESHLLRKTNEFATYDPLSSSSKKINLTGKYITLYEDNDSGRIVTRKAPAELKVIGSTVHGTTKFGETKEWKIVGKVYQKKRVTGVYYANDELDDGMGTFYLEVKSPSILEGYWGGYDSDNKQLFSGKYVFKKMFDQYRIRKATINDFPSLINISNEQLGSDYLSSDLLAKTLEPNSALRCNVIVNKLNNKILGFSLNKVIDNDELNEILKGKEKIREFSFEERIGYIKTVAINKKFEGYGLSTALLEYSLKEFEKEGVKKFVSTAWKHCGIINIGGVLSRLGFVKRVELPDYWYEDSIKEGFQCPQCGNPCHCTCVVYIKY